MSGKKLAGAALAITFVAGGVAGAVIAAPTVSAAYDGGSDYRTDDGGKGDRMPGRPHRPGAGPLAVAAKTIGVTEEELIGQLRDGKSIADVAKAKGKDPADVVDAIVAQRTERIDKEVEDGAIDKEEAAKRKKEFAEVATRIVNRSGLPERDGKRFGAPGRPPLDTAAKTIGVTEEDLLAELRDGKSIADVAKAKGKDPAGVVDAMVTDMSARIDKAVKDGRVSEDDAKQRKERLSDAITAMVNQEGLPARMRHPGSGDQLREPARPR